MLETKALTSGYSLQTQLILTVPPQLSNNLLFLTNRVARQLTAISLEGVQLDGWRPQGTHLGIMADLLNGDGVRQQDLAISAIKDKATIARSLGVLEREGFVDRKIDRNDRRQKLIFLTNKGRQLHQEVMPMLLGRMEKQTQSIDPAELQICLGVLLRLYEQLQKTLASNNSQ